MFRPKNNNIGRVYNFDSDRHKGRSEWNNTKTPSIIVIRGNNFLAEVFKKN